MKESTQNIHIEALHYLSGIPFDSNLGIRANKVNILESLGFSKGTNIALIKEFNASQEDGVRGLQGYLYQQLEHNKFVSMLFNGMGWESSGGSPVVYVMSKEDIDKKLEFRDRKLASAHSQEGKDFEIDNKVRLQTYSRQQSIEMAIDGLDNYSGETRIKAGGGFRLQLDNISSSEGKLKFTFSSIFSFNDMGSRVLALSSAEDQKVPRYSNSFQVEVVDGKLVYLPSDQKDITSVQNANDLSEVLIKNLFDTDGAAISLLYRYLLNVRPSLKTHQLEGIFSITTANGISTEVIDFDGIDTFDLNGCDNSQLNPTERLIAAHLRANGYALTDSQRLISFIQFRENVENSLIQISNSEMLPNQIKEVLESIKITNPEDIFNKSPLGSAKLARLLKGITGDNHNETNQQIRHTQTVNGDLFVLSIEGFEMAFLLKDGELIDFTDIKKQKGVLSQELKTDIVDAQFSYVREGD